MFITMAKGLPAPQQPIVKLGLPPMELAESSRQNGRNITDDAGWIFPLLQKIIVMMLLLVLGAGTYALMIKLWDYSDSTISAEVILFSTEDKSPNVTIQDQMDLILHLKNKTAIGNKIRGKRHIRSPFESYASGQKNLAFNENQLEIAKKMILQHNLTCQQDHKTEMCQALIKKLKFIAKKNKIVDTTEQYNVNSDFKYIMKNNSPISNKNLKEKRMSLKKDVLKKREAVPATQLLNIMESVPHIESRDGYGYGHINSGNIMTPPHAPVSPLTDTCLLARLLKHNYPHVHEIYDSPSAEYRPYNYDNPGSPSRHRYYSPLQSPSYIHGRDVEERKTKLHPQDVDIFMSFLTPKQMLLNDEATNVTASDEPECIPGTVPCDSNSICIVDVKWCDGTVDCPDASDESQCACKSRVDKARLCDGYFDCPFGEDEMGCFGCPENGFSCNDLDVNSHSTCFTKQQRCDDIADCPNHKDEIECTMLAPGLLKKSLFAISNTEGYLHRNFKGEWHAVCQNPYMWAHDACRRETGLIIRPPFIQVFQIDPMLKITYLNTGPGGSLEVADTCFNSSAMYVTCPDLLCGTRVLSTSQILLKENPLLENRFFGRNKRFLMSGRPYPLFFYGSRKKRQTDMFYYNGTLDNYYDDEAIYQKALDHNIRNIRAQSRVVGGSPSLPAAWPWMVALYRNGMFHCGGVVITQNWIMSAAHCVHKFWDHYYEVQVGMLRRFSFSPQEHNHKVTHVIVNQHYRHEDMKNDLSLLRVEPVIQFSRWVRPICLPGPDTAGPNWLWGPSPDTICTAVGWGATIEHGPDPDHMREVEVPIWEHCKHREDRAGKEICAGPVEGGKDACQGDSGGPLLCRNPINSQQWYIAGIVSHGDGCARKQEPGVYTRVSLFVKWIRYHISSKSLPIVMPIQECPGFKCKSGLSKCIPTKRKCDKIVDCLGAEDEVGCTDIKSERTFGENNIFMTEMFKSNDNTSAIEKSRKIKDTTMDATETIGTTTTIETNEIFSEVVEVAPVATTITWQTQITNNESTPSSISTNIESAEAFFGDLVHASTPEIPNSQNTEEVLINSFNISEVNLMSLTTTEEVEYMPKENIETVTISFLKDSLESRSSVLGTLPNQDNVYNVESTTQMLSAVIKNVTDEDVSTVQLEELHLKTTTDNTLHIKPNIKKYSSNKTNDKLFENIETIILNDTQTVNSGYNNQGSTLSTLTDFINQSETIETYVFSDLVPPKLRRKYRIPKEFECARIFQVIPYSQRCNHKADCEDGTDELDCTCVDFISTFDISLICDGFSDCADGQDEIDCYNCPENHFLCKRSRICVHVNHVCDGKFHCPQGDDEVDCYALSNGKELLYGSDKRPMLKMEGYLTQRHQNEWHVLCEDKMTLQEIDESATHICHYLGFSSAVRYFIKYINVQDDDILESSSEYIRKKRDIEIVPVHFTYRGVSPANKTTSQTFIKEPQVLEEICVPNITKTCKSLYVICDRSLFTDFNTTSELTVSKTINEFSNGLWPWIAKVFVEGEYKCTGVLVELSWVVVSQSCLWDTSAHNFVSVVLGSHRTLNSSNGYYEQVYQINGKKDLYRNKIALLHLMEPAKYSNMVKPMIVSNLFSQPEQSHICVAIGQDNNNVTLNVLLEETNENCNSHNVCFKRKETNSICPINMVSKRQWAGIISCHTQHGWNPIASFVDSRGECGIGNHINATDIENLKREIKFFSKKKIFSESMEQEDSYCEGQRCSRGRCIDVDRICDGVRQCEDGMDESEEACLKKHNICVHDPYRKGCGCTIGEMKCRNGKCIAKELFRDGRDDCGDSTDEPIATTCSDYLARVMPSRLCDGILHCHDRSDENPMFCKCYAKKIYRCGKTTHDIDRCVAPDMVCDGVLDCPNGEDEQTCIGLSAPEGTQYGSGQVMVRSHGVWYSKCYSSPNHTKSELEAICRELGFLSGHAKKIKAMDSHKAYNNLLLHPFSEVVLNNKTVIKMRNNDEPIAKPIFNENLKDCFPVFIECI